MQKLLSIRVDTTKIIIMAGVQSICCLVGVLAVYQGGRLDFTKNGVQDGRGVQLPA